MPPPAKPAQVSGPGPMSRRTDGGAAQALRDLPDAKYGENSQFQSLQQGAPLAASGGSPTAMPFSPQSLPPNPAANSVVPFSAPSARPDEPVTSGASLGAGPDTSALGLQPGQVEQQDLSKIRSSLPLLEMLANQPDALPSTRLMVNLLKASG